MAQTLWGEFLLGFLERALHLGRSDGYKKSYLPDIDALNADQYVEQHGDAVLKSLSRCEVKFQRNSSLNSTIPEHGFVSESLHRDQAEVFATSMRAKVNQPFGIDSRRLGRGEQIEVVPVGDTACVIYLKPGLFAAKHDPHRTFINSHLRDCADIKLTPAPAVAEQEKPSEPKEGDKGRIIKHDFAAPGITK